MSDAGDTRGLVVVISGPSGSGKSTICRLVQDRISVEISVSATTRAARENEIDGQSYRFLTPKRFRRLIDEGAFVEYAEYNGYLYGTPAAPLREALRQRRIVLLDVDVQGGRQILAEFPNAVTIFIVAPSREALHERLDKRRSDTFDALHWRLERADEEVRYARESGVYQYFVTNDDLQEAVRQVVDIIKRERNSP